MLYVAAHLVDEHVVDFDARLLLDLVRLALAERVPASPEHHVQRLVVIIGASSTASASTASLARLVLVLGLVVVDVVAMVAIALLLLLMMMMAQH